MTVTLRGDIKTSDYQNVFSKIIIKSMWCIIVCFVSLFRLSDFFVNAQFPILETQNFLTETWCASQGQIRKKTSCRK